MEAEKEVINAAEAEKIEEVSEKTENPKGEEKNIENAEKESKNEETTPKIDDKTESEPNDPKINADNAVEAEKVAETEKMDVDELVAVLPQKRKASEMDTEETVINVNQPKDDPPILEKGDSSANDSSSELNLPPKQTLGKGKRARIPNKRYGDIILSPTSRSQKHNVENGDKFDADDEEIRHIPIKNIKNRSNTNSPVAKKHKIVDVKDPKYMKPFELGWKRELVYRSNTIPNSIKRDGDIYYYTPAGKKIRSMREILENLTGKDLDIENFTFTKEPIGLDDPEKEIIRDAKVKTKKFDFGKKPPVLSPKASTSKSAEVAPVRISSRNLGNAKEAQAKLVKGKSDKKEESKSEVEMKRQAANRKNSKTSSSDLAGKPCQPCSIRCQGVLGMVPTLQCRICLCLYHHECVGLNPHSFVEAYICKNCHLEHGQTVTSSPSIALPPLTPINALKSMTTQSTVLPKLQRIPRPNEDPPNPPPISPESLPGLVPLPPLLQPAPKPSRRASANPPDNGTNNNNNNNNNKSLVGAVTSWLPHSSTIQLNNVQQRNDRPQFAPRPQYVEYLAGRKFLVIPKHNVVSVSPTVVNTSRVIENDYIPNNPDPPVKNEPDSPISVDNNPDLGGMEVEGIVEEEGGKSDQNMKDGDDLLERSDTPKSKKRIMTRSNNTTTTTPTQHSQSDKKDDNKFMDNYLQNLSFGYNTLLYVFQYLKVQDLLRAGCVCTMWRDVANHPSLWRTVRMKNSQVHSFDGLANTLKRNRTVHLDLRKMLLPSGGDEIWPEFSEAIEKVQSLRKIELCRCPAMVVEQIARTNKNLEVINAVTIKSVELSLDPFADLTELRDLKLKSGCGLQLTSDLSALKNLQNLRCLSLTSITDLHKMDMRIIAGLTNLESLDLGECTDFPENFGSEILSKLTNLEKLRLEKGHGNCHIFEILDSVKDMPRLEQLELVNFDIKSGFDQALGKCTNIKKLLLIPTYVSQSATTNHMVLGGLLKLQATLSHLVWGVTLELLRVTELFIDQCNEDGNKRERGKEGSADCIPVLKPVPLVGIKDDDNTTADDPPQVEILSLPKLQKLLLRNLPTTKVKILKIPFHATWRQSITDTVN